MTDPCKRTIHVLTALKLLIIASWQPLAQAQISIREGLVAEWNFDESSGLEASDSAGSNTGSLVGFDGSDSQWIDGKVGGAIQFDGASYVEVPDAPSIGAPTSRAA